MTKHGSIGAASFLVAATLYLMAGADAWAEFPFDRVAGAATAATTNDAAAPPPSPDPVRSGETIYREMCASCHGGSGEGVAGEHDEPLYGYRSLDSLTRLIHRTMPEDEPDQCVDEDAAKVAAYVYESFYSPAARTRLQPPRVAFARLTNDQFRHSIADLVGGFRETPDLGDEHGLRARYWNKPEKEDEPERSFERVDAAVDFDFGGESPDPERLGGESFNISWRGSLVVEESGDYGFRIRTRNGVRLWINPTSGGGGGGRRGDREPALIDGWVSSDNEERVLEERVFLLGGRAYPVRLEFFKFKEPAANVTLEWKPPEGEWAVVPADQFRPVNAPRVTVVSVDLPPDDGSLGYERGTMVSAEWLHGTTAAAIEVAAEVAAQVETLAGLEEENGSNDRGEGDGAEEGEETAEERAARRLARIGTFARAFVERAFRRPLTGDEMRRFVEDPLREATGSGGEGDVDVEAAVKRIVLLTLGSPRFLFPEAALADPDGPVTDHAVAARLALALWDSLPDAALRDAADRGELRNADAIRSHAVRMVEDERARLKVREFFAHWLAMDEAEDVSKDTEVYPGFDEALLADLRTSLETFIDGVFWSEASDYRELLLADYLYLNPRLAEFYGTGDADSPGFRRVSLDGAQRAGIITHPFVLSVLSYHRSSSPIHRGVFLTRNVLGRFLKPPPMAIEFMDDRFDPHLTMREKVAQLTGKETCMGCHVTINPLGFSLENFDAVGRFRTTDNDRPVDPVSEYLTPDGETILLEGPRDVAEHAVENREAQIGFVRHLFHHVVKQPPAAYGLDTLSRLHAGFVAGGFNMRELLVSIATVPGAQLLAAAHEGAEGSDPHPADPAAPGAAATLTEPPDAAAAQTE